MGTKAKIGAELLARLRDYACEEPSFTTAFAAWELGVSPSAVSLGVKELLRLDIIRQIEPRSGPYGAVYEYKPVPNSEPKRRAIPELDAAISNAIGELAPRRGEAVPFTGGPVGPSGRPGYDKRRQERGHRVKRQRQGT